MYSPPKHKPLSEKAILEFIQKYRFATLCCTIEGRLEATHIPLEYTLKKNSHFLTGHIARSNSITHAIENSLEVICIFMQPHAYISSSWYDHINVPTWNYIAVHAYGKLRKLENEELVNSIRDLVEHYEKDRSDRFKLEDMPEDMLNAHLNGVTGFEIAIDKFESSFKLSQNRNETDYLNIINQLIQSPNQYDKEIAEIMRDLKSTLTGSE